MTLARRAALLLVFAVPACLPLSSPPPTGGAGFLQASWDAYKDRYLHANGYVLDRTRGNGEVTSEGQSYALLRAAWLDDRAAFARVFDAHRTHAGAARRLVLVAVVSERRRPRA